MTLEYRAERTITAVFKEEQQVDNVVRRLIDRYDEDENSVWSKAKVNV